MRLDALRAEAGGQGLANAGQQQVLDAGVVGVAGNGGLFAGGEVALAKDVDGVAGGSLLGDLVAPLPVATGIDPAAGTWSWCL